MRSMIVLNIVGEMTSREHSKHRRSTGSSVLLCKTTTLKEMTRKLESGTFFIFADVVLQLLVTSPICMPIHIHIGGSEFSFAAVLSSAVYRGENII